MILRVVDRERIATRATVRRKYRGKGYKTLVFETARKRYDVRIDDSAGNNDLFRVDAG